MIVLDTQAWVWWVAEPGRLSRASRRAIEREEARAGLVVSAISIWEVALKVGIGKLTLDRDVRSWIVLATSYPGISVEPLARDDALESVLLPEWEHRDPADRFIVALARRLEASLVTSDERIRDYEHVKTIW